MTVTMNSITKSVGLGYTNDPHGILTPVCVRSVGLVSPSWIRSASVILVCKNGVLFFGVLAARVNNIFIGVAPPCTSGTRVAYV